MQRIVFVLLLIIAIAPIKLFAQYEIMFSNSYPPYNYINDDGELVGFNIDITNAIIELYKSDIKISGDSWGNINKALESGEIHAIGGTHYPGGSDNNFIFTRSAINTSHCFIYNTNHLNDLSLELFRSIKKPIVAVWQNIVLNHYILSINPSTQFIYLNNYEDLVNSLDREDVTCIFAQRVGSMYYADKLGKDYVAPLDHRILERNMGFKVSKEHPELAELINNGLEVILANGEYQRIYDKWINEYNKDVNDWHKYLKYILIIIFLIISVFLFLIIINRFLQRKVRHKTKDLQRQLELNSQMVLELEKQKIKAEESDKMKSAFLANMSHEIRTPMNGILGFASLLKSADYSSDAQEKFIRIIQKSGNRMLETINNIIDVSKLDSGSEKEKITEVNIESIMNELVNFFGPEASSKGLNLTLNKKSSAFVQSFFTDEYKLNSILTNLIKNAIKFTPAGSVEVSYTVTDEICEFWVRDTGIGIPLDKQKSIFDHFVQADSSYSSGFEGSGLGLSISKGYVKLLHGKISIDSDLNKGTTFYVQIPNKVSDSTMPINKTKEQFSKQPTQSKFNILVAEDDEISFSFLKIALEDIYNKIVHAKDGLEAVRLAKANSDIDIILMDVRMPNLDGIEATKEIRKFNKDVIIIAQTAHVQESYRTEIKEAGCDHYISKPIDKQKLINLINTHNN